MDKSRREMLEEFIQQKPNDSFAHYGLAMEYANAGRHDDALATFQKLLGFNPDYAYAYYHAGALLGSSAGGRKPGRCSSAAWKSPGAPATSTPRASSKKHFTISPASARGAPASGR